MVVTDDTKKSLKASRVEEGVTEAIHPSIRAVVDEVTTGIMNGQLTDQKSIAAATLYCQFRAIEYSKVFATIGAGFVGVIIATAIAWVKLGMVPALVIFAIAAIGWSIPSFRIYKKNDRRLTWPELDSLKPALSLSPAQSTYLTCLQAVDESRTIVPTEKEVWANLLNTALEHNDQSLLERTKSALLTHDQADTELEQIKRQLTALTH